MGSFLGKINVETPKFEVIKSSNEYEIRKYSPCVVAEITYDSTQFGGNRDGGFRILASYIGVLGKPENTKPEKIAMTAPVITHKSETGDDDHQIQSGGGRKESVGMVMQFVLPASKYSKAEEAPRPIDERVVIKDEGERKFGVVRFSGVAIDEIVEEKVEKLKKSLERDGYKVIEGKPFLLGRYNPPWTLPFLRTNEIMIPIV